MGNDKCFIGMLNKLKISSKEAVEGTDELNEFNKYMHVSRDEIEEEFTEIIFNAQNLEKAQLILVCGSVGDGKSHLISYFKNENLIKPDTEIYNDATESFGPRKNPEQTLSEQLIEFSDDNIKNSNKKLILAINLGTLTNFIDSEYSNNFSKLKAYVKEKEILEKTIIDNKFDSESNFQFINFTDYHMYSLTENGPKSDYMYKLIKKVVNVDEENPIYREYRATCCNNCECASRCPVKENYQNLMIEKIQKKIIDKLIEIIIKKKIIISTRALLNFIYDILVYPYLANIPEKDFINKIKSLRPQEYLKALTANLLYENRETMNIINSINFIDPLNVRNEKIDNLIINLNNTKKFKFYFDKYIDNYSNHYYYKLLDEESTYIGFKNDVIKFLIRVLSINPKDEYLDIYKDNIYEKYMTFLYHYNRSDKHEMKEILNFIKTGIYKWNGKRINNEQINLAIGNRQSDFELYEDLKIVGQMPCEKEKKDILNKFNDTILLIYKVPGVSEEFKIDVDFSLYELLKKIELGYRLNKKDKNNFVNFVDFVDTLQKYGSHKDIIYFDYKLGNDIKKFEFKMDEFGDYCLMERE